MVLGVNVSNPFRAAKWRSRSTTVKIRDEDGSQGASMPSSVPTTSAPPSTAQSGPANSNHKKKSTDDPPLNSDSQLNGIGNYIFQSPLGSGKFSKVMLAYHYQTKEKVAIKVINKRAHIYKIMSRLAREIQIMEILKHENIVELYETIETADTMYLIMEYVPGLNLEEHLKAIKNNCMAEDDVRYVFRQVVKAVDHCHSKWIVHRDLKTPNILITPDLNVKIADFGLGNRFGLQRLGTQCGSMLYYSPEIVQSRTYNGPEVDAWCLGVMLFKMAAGYELFAHAKSATELKHYILNRQYKFPSHLSPPLQATIQKFLSVDRFDRLCLQNFLATDPWFNNFGEFGNVFEERSDIGFYSATDAMRLVVASVKSEGRSSIKRSMQISEAKCKQDMYYESMYKPRLQKTVVYHITNPSTYFTGPARHSSRQPIDLNKQSEAIAELHRNIIATTRQVKLQLIQNGHLSDIKSPINHLFRKLKKTEEQQPLRKTSSTMSISQLYQRVAKDYVVYFSIQCNINTESSTTAVSGCSTSSTLESGSHYTLKRPNNTSERPPANNRLSHRISMAFFPKNNDSSLTTTLDDEEIEEEEISKQSQSEVLRIVRMACEILGITFYQPSKTQLVCLLTLRNYKKPIVIAPPTPQTSTTPSTPTQQSQVSATQQSQYGSLFRSKMFSSSDRLSDLHKKHGNSSSSNTNVSGISDYSSTSAHNSKWKKRFSALLSNFTFNNSSGALLTTAASGFDLVSVGRINQQEAQVASMQQQQQQQQQEASEIMTEDDEEGFAVLTVEAGSVPNTKLNEDGTTMQAVSLRYSKVKGSNKVFKLAKGWIQEILSENNNRQITKSDIEAYLKAADEPEQQQQQQPDAFRRQAHHRRSGLLV